MDSVTKFKRARDAVRESSFFVGPTDGPAGDDLRESRDIVLRVAAVNPQGMQFEYFAGKIFVQADPLFAPTPIGAFAPSSIQAQLNVGCRGR